MALRNSDPLPRAIAWGAVIFSSALPTIIWRESGHARSFWLALIQVHRVLLDRPYPELAAAMGISVDAARANVYQALKRLREGVRKREAV